MDSLGKDLTAARENRNIPLEKVAAELKISQKYLLCLEQARYDELPGGMYNRAFLRSYCDYLGLNASDFVRRYEAEAGPQAGERAPKLRMKSFQPVAYRPMNPLITWCALLAVTIIGLYFSRKWVTAVFSPYFARPPVAALPPEQPKRAQASVPAAVEPKNDDMARTATEPPLLPPAPPVAPGAAQSPAGSQTESPAAATESAQTASAGAIRIQFHGLEKCWVSVSSDGRRVMEQVLEPGEDRSFSASEQFKVILGNAGGVRLTINGQPAKPLGKSGEVIRLLIDAQSIHDLVETKSTG
jgi:cytoskeleton protein RodZ